MKRILASCVLAGLIVAISVGCGGDSSKPAPATKPGAATTPPAKDKMDAKKDGEKK